MKMATEGVDSSLLERGDDFVTPDMGLPVIEDDGNQSDSSTPLSVNPTHEKNYQLNDKVGFYSINFLYSLKLYK